MFWLDVEHFKHFDGSRDDLKLLANCIILKYMVEMAEIPVDLPTEMVEKITQDVESNIRQGNITVLVHVLSCCSGILVTRFLGKDQHKLVYILIA